MSLVAVVFVVHVTVVEFHRWTESAPTVYGMLQEKKT